jgi:hypothetical protein
MGTQQQDKPTDKDALKCGPQTKAHSQGGGLTYLYCAEHKGHQGQHKP